MRLKLVLIVAIIAGIVGSGASIGIILGAFSSLHALRTPPGMLVLTTLLIPLIAILLSAIFVYRHTARRRKLQAFLTAVLTTILTLTAFVVTAFFTAQPSHLPTPPPANQRTVT
jgi:hypothetical protein